MNGKKARALRRGDLWMPRRGMTWREAYQATKKRAKRSRISQSQKAKLIEPRKRRPKEPIKPTWPGTDDQKLQGRPLIVAHPWRAIKKAVPWRADSIDQNLPKHELDAIARSVRA